MEKAFEDLQKQGKNSMAELIEWMKNVKIVDGVKITEDKVKTLFDGIDASSVGLDKFKDVLDKLAVDTSQNVDEFRNKLAKTEAAVAKAAEDLAKTAQANVNAVANDVANAINTAGASAANTTNAGTSAATTEESSKKPEDIIKMVAEKGPKLASAFGAAASAFSSAMKK